MAKACTNYKVNAIYDCQMQILTKVIITILNAHMEKLLRFRHSTNTRGVTPTGNPASTQQRVTNSLPGIRQMAYRGLAIGGPTMCASMTRKCHNHRLQTNPQHREVETQNTDSHITMKVQTTIFLLFSKMITKYERTQGTSYKGTNRK